MTRCRPLLGLLFVVLLPPWSCTGPPGPSEAVSADRPGRWETRDVTGLPATAEIADVVVRDGVWVAVGSVQGRPVAFQPLDLGIWRSRDGVAWQEAYRTRAQGDESTSGHVTVTSDGFALAGTTCRNQVCRPIAV